MKKLIERIFRKKQKGSLTLESIIVTPIVFLAIIVAVFLVIMPAIDASDYCQQVVSYDIYNSNVYQIYSALGA